MMVREVEMPSLKGLANDPNKMRHEIEFQPVRLFLDVMSFWQNEIHIKIVLFKWKFGTSYA